MRQKNILAADDVDEETIDAIAMHNEMATNKTRSTPFHYALVAGETVTELIVATALVYPDKKLVSVKPKSVTKRVKGKLFAASVNREIIMECEKLNIPLAKFVELSLTATLPIINELGL